MSTTPLSVVSLANKVQELQSTLQSLKDEINSVHVQVEATERTAQSVAATVTHNEAIIEKKEARDRATNFLWHTYGAIGEWIRFADVKAGATLAANAALIYAGTSTVEKQIDFLIVRWGIGIFVMLVILCLLFSSLAALSCISPSLVTKTADEWLIKSLPWLNTRVATGNDSRIYFDDIAKNYKGDMDGVKSYIGYMFASTGLSETDDKVLIPDPIYQIAAQVVVNAKVASDKHKKIKIAVGLHRAALVGAFLTLIVGIWVNRVSPVLPEAIKSKTAPTVTAVAKPIPAKISSPSPHASVLPSGSKAPAARLTKVRKK